MSKPTILFVDECCNKSYDINTLLNEALGGTEATVVRITEGLSHTNLFHVHVEQHTRGEEDFSQTRGCLVLTGPVGFTQRADYVISLRSPETLAKAKLRFPKAKHYLWNHDLCTTETARVLSQMSGFTSLVVSNFHKSQMTEVLKPQGYSGQFLTKVIYNPIDNGLQPDDTPVDRNKLVFFSSPHKGLSDALFLFSNLRSFNRDFKLYVSNPGYVPLPEDLSNATENSIVVRGPVPHHRAIADVREALCVFYPNKVFPETFGLVFAEANAVGTPVLTHPLGAADEVLYHPNEFVDCNNPKAVINRVMSWYNGHRPKVKGNNKFRLSTVLNSWIRLFSDY